MSLVDADQILACFRGPSTAKTVLCKHAVHAHLDFIHVQAIFNGNVTRLLTVLSDGSDVVDEVRSEAERLCKRYPNYSFTFSGFLSR